MSSVELVVILSIFTNIRVSDDDCVYDPTILEIPYVCKKYGYDKALCQQVFRY